MARTTESSDCGCLTWTGEQCRRCEEKDYQAALDRRVSSWAWNNTVVDCAREILDLDLCRQDVYAAMERAGFPQRQIDATRDAVDALSA